MDEDAGEVLERAVRATAVGRGAHGVPELRRLVEGALSQAFPHRTWVAGRIGEVRREQQVGLHFTLLAAADDTEPLELSCLVAEESLPAVADVLDRVHDADVEDLVCEGRLARVGGLLRYDPLRATLVLGVSELDPTPAVRGLQEDRAAVRERVREHGLLDRQRSRSSRSAPLAVTVIGGLDDPAAQAAVEALRAAPYALELRAVSVALQGREAPSAVACAVREASLRSDLVLLVRDVGRPLALSVFDATEVAYAVAQASVPVVAGLGGAGERTVTDEVAHACVPDGPAATRWVLGRLDEAGHTLRHLAAGIEDEAGQAVDRARHDLERARDEVGLTGHAAQARARTARAQAKVRALAVAGLLVVALVAAAFLLGSAWPLVGLAVLAVLAAALWARSARAMRRGSKPMSQQDDEFATVLARLRQVRDELAATSSPEAVHRLRDAARQLVEHGERILGRPLEATGAQRIDLDAQPVGVS